MSVDAAPRSIVRDRSGVAVAVALTIASVYLAGFARRQAGQLRDAWPPEADLMYLPSSSTLRRLSLGHTELAADLIAARANVYYGTQITTKAPQLWLHQYVNRAADLDPNFHRIYQSGAAMLVYNGGAIQVEAVERANALLERGEKAFPMDWNLTFQLGFNLFFELPEASGREDPRVPGWQARGVEALRRAALFDGVPHWLPNLTARLLTKQGADELAIRHLEQAYAATSSEETRKQIRGKLEELMKGRNLVDQMEEGRRDFEADMAKGYSYAPEAFSVIAGPRRSQATELPARGFPADDARATTRPSRP